MFDPYVLRKDFPMYVNQVKMQGKPLVFLDNASTTFKPYSVEKAVRPLPSTSSLSATE